MSFSLILMLLITHLEVGGETIVYLCVCEHAHACICVSVCGSAHVNIRGQLVEVGSLVPSFYHVGSRH